MHMQLLSYIVEMTAVNIESHAFSLQSPNYYSRREKKGSVIQSKES